MEVIYTLGDGESETLPDGRLIRCRIVPDEFTAVNDFDVYGRAACVELNESRRPEGFTGNAEKLSYGNEGPWWWEPPADVKRSDEGFAELRECVRELLAFGFSTVVVELCDGVDAYGHPVVVDVEALSAVDTTDPAYVGEVSRELVSELLNR